MLADDIVSEIGTFRDHESFGAVPSWFEGRMKDAQRFVLAPSFMEAANNVASAKPSSVLEACKIARLPFPTCWIEWEAHIAGRDYDRDNGKPLPSKIGVLAEAQNDLGTTFHLTYFWTHKANGLTTIQPCWTGIIVDLLHEGTIDDDNIPGKGSLFEKFKSEKEHTALRSLAAKAMAGVFPHMEKYYLAYERQFGRTKAEQMTASFGDDLKGEIQIVMAIFCLLNCRVHIVEETSDFQALNKARAKRGIRPLMSFTAIKLRASRKFRQVTETCVDGSAIRQHLVRGHFKIRGGKLYWWRPFVRGDAAIGVSSRKAYRVVGMEGAAE